MVSMKNNSLKVKVVWMPNVDQNPGTDFVVKYSVNGTQQWVSTARIVMDDFVIVDGLLPTETYEMFVESIEGNFVTESNIKMIPRYRMGTNDNMFIRQRILVSFFKSRISSLTSR